MEIQTTILLVITIAKWRPFHLGIAVLSCCLFLELLHLLLLSLPRQVLLLLRQQDKTSDLFFFPSFASRHRGLTAPAFRRTKRRFTAIPSKTGPRSESSRANPRASPPRSSPRPQRVASTPRLQSHPPCSSPPQPFPRQEQQRCIFR